MNEERTPVSRSALLLTETLIAVLFFAVAGAICLQVFAGTHRLTEKTEWLNFAVEQVSSAAEVLSREPAAGSNKAEVLQCLQLISPLAEENEGSICLSYDGEKSPCTADEAAYCLTVTFAPGAESGMTDYALSFAEAGEDESLYGLELQVYCPMAERSAG